VTVTSPPWERQRRAMAVLEWRQKLSANWQIALSDESTEMMTRVDFSLRKRLRTVMESAEEHIEKSVPTGHWKGFEEGVRSQVDAAVLEAFDYARQSSHRLSEHVAAALAGNRDGSHKGVPLPKLNIPDPEEALRSIKPMTRPKGGDGFPRIVNSLRGSYGGILMVGVLTSLAGLQLISVYSVAAGVALGLFTWWEDRKNGKERGKAEVKMALAKYVDETNFEVGEELRAELRRVHRVLRDHYTVINDRNLRLATDEVNAAMTAG
jgi:hypothetical protein